MDVEIRPLSPADGERLGRMHYASWREAYAAFLPADFWSETAEQQWIGRWASRVQAPETETTTRVAVRDDAVLGFATEGPARPNPTAGPPVRDRELWSLYIRASEYGSGLAGRLLAAVLPDGVPAELWVFEANGRARRFYERNGFRPDGARHQLGPEYGNQAEVRMIR